MGEVVEVTQIVAFLRHTQDFDRFYQNNRAHVAKTFILTFLRFVPDRVGPSRQKY